MSVLSRIAQLASWLDAPDSTPPAAPKSSLGGNGAQGTEVPVGSGTRGGGYFEALRESGERIPITQANAILRASLSDYSRRKLCDLGTYLYDNTGPVAYTIDTLSNYSVPIRPTPTVADAEAGKAYLAYWNDWCKTADHSGQFTFDDLQRIGCKNLDRHGDAGFLMTDANGFPQIQLIESQYIKGDDSEGSTKSGVRLDANGAVVSYQVGSQKFSRSEFLLLMDPDRVADYRGYSPLRRGMNDIRDASDIKGFEKVASKLNAAIACVVEGGPIEDGTLDFKTNAEGSGDELSGVPDGVDGTQAASKLTVMELLGGDIPVLSYGQKLSQISSTRPNLNAAEFVTILVGWFVMGCGLPPAFILDEKLTGPNLRSVNGKAQRKMDQRQVVMARMVEWAWVRVIGYGIKNGALPVATGWWNIEWHGPAKLSIDAGRETAQERSDVVGKLMSREEHFAARDLSWRREVDQMFIEDDLILNKCAEQAARMNLPVELILARWGFEMAKAAQATIHEQPPTP